MANVIYVSHHAELAMMDQIHVIHAHLDFMMLVPRNVINVIKIVRHAMFHQEIVHHVKMDFT